MAKPPLPPEIISSTSMTPSQPQRQRLVDLSHEDRLHQLGYSLDYAERQLEPATTEQITQMLSVVAATLGCPIPPIAVITKYIEMLSPYPIDLIDQAGDTVLRKHVWNTFPRVAEFISVLDVEHKERLSAKRNTLDAIAFYEGNEGQRALTRPHSGGKGPRSLASVLPELKEPE